MTKQKKKYSNCQNCGKPIESGKFCSTECSELFFRKPEGAKPLAVKQDNDFKKAFPLSAKILKEEENKINPDSIFWSKGEGMNRRCHNIDQIKDLISSGLSYQQIVRVARKYFNSKKIDEYYDIALDEIKNPLEESIQDKITEIRRKKTN
jgi:hypothetical protein